MSAEHGNFQRYYSLRPRAVALRLAALDAHLFRARSCLDVGCNEGGFSLAVAGRYRVAHMLGVDLDARLVARAEASLTRVLETHRRLLHPALPRTCASLDKYFLERVRFEVHDVMGGSIGGSFDTVLCLSVTKWVHLRHGDQGIRKLFGILRELTRVGGNLVLEYQKWQSYKNDRNSSALARRNFSELRLAPESFCELLCAEFGFRLERAMSLNEADVFRRPLLVLVRCS